MSRKGEGRSLVSILALSQLTLLTCISYPQWFPYDVAGPLINRKVLIPLFYLYVCKYDEISLTLRPTTASRITIDQN